jgi:hypothetical protein
MSLRPEDHEPLFRPLEPPPGGPARLRERLARERERAARPRRAWAWAAPALAAAATVAILLLASPPKPSPGNPASDPGRSALAELVRDSLAQPTLASLGLAPRAAQPVEVAGPWRGTTALLRMPVDDHRVVLYLMAQVGP